MKLLKLLFLMVLSTNLLNAQEKLDFSGKEGIKSPEIKEGKVTFYLVAPNANKVQLQGNWMPYDQNYQVKPVDLVKNDSGIWSYSLPLPSDLYTYNFVVDGVVTTDPNNVYNVRDVSSIMNIFLVEGGKADQYKIQDVPHGTVSKRWYTSKGLKMDRRLSVYTPAGYENSKEKLPVLYLLHGVGGDEEAWLTLGRTAQILDNLIAQGKVKPMLVVMPNGHTSNSAAPGESSKGYYKPVMFTPDVFNSDMEFYFPEIIDFVEKNYRVIADKKHRALAGLSMGGFHSLYISANHPELFDYVGLFSPAVQPLEGKDFPTYQNLDEKLRKQLVESYKLYWIAIGKVDFLYKNVTEFRSKLNSFGFKYTYVESEGGHTWSNWRDYLVEFTPLLFK